jgi:hypothetical protein
MRWGRPATRFAIAVPRIIVEAGIQASRKVPRHAMAAVDAPPVRPAIRISSAAPFIFAAIPAAGLL